MAVAMDHKPNLSDSKLAGQVSSRQVRWQQFLSWLIVNGTIAKLAKT